MEKDKWVHRSLRMKCLTCIYYSPKDTKEEFIQVGRCKRCAPTMKGFPVVFPEDWCGEHKLNENTPQSLWEELK